MSYFTEDAPLVPRNGHTLIVGIVARISGCQNQKELSLEDQVDHGKEVVHDIYSGAVDYRTICTTGKGERIDRPELAQLETELRKREMDLLVIEDLGRLVRGAEASTILGLAVDHGTRVISPNDCIDTVEGNWEQDALEACSEHVAHNVRTSKRIKQKVMNRFLKFGFTAKRDIYGYVVSEKAKSFADWQKDEAATAIIQEGANRLLASLNCTAVAEWFEAQKVPVGPYCRRKSWNGAMVKRFYSNRLLSGRPSRGSKHTIKVHATGRRIAVNNPKGPKFLDYPHLAHLDPGFQDELIAALQDRNARFKRTPVDGSDPLTRVPRKRTRFPGQHACCWYCGRQYVWGGNGMTDNLMCSGAREWKCWNSIGFNGALAATNLVEIILQDLDRLEGFDDQYAALVQQAANHDSSGLKALWQTLHRNEATLQRERDNVATAIRTVGPHLMLKDQLDGLDARAQELARERGRLQRLGERKLIVPPSTSELRGLLEEEFRRLAIDSPEFGDLLRQLVPEFHVYLVRLCDGGHLLPRARVRLDLAGSIADSALVPGLKELLTRTVAVDLFVPPQRERIREEAVRSAPARREDNPPNNWIAAQLSEKATSTAVSNALHLDKLMESQGLTSPYIQVQEPPGDYPKLRRHKNSKYRFEPQEGYERLVL